MWNCFTTSIVLSFATFTTLPEHYVTETDTTVNMTTEIQLTSWDMIGGYTIWPPYLLAAFGGRLLATFSVAGIPAHWVNTSREIKEVIPIIHRKAVPPHNLAKFEEKKKKNAIA